VKQLVYEVQIGQRFLAGPLSRKVKSIEVLNVLRHDRNEISVICNVKFKDQFSRTLFEDAEGECQLLEQEGSIFTFFVKRRLPRPPRGVNPRSVFLSTPWKVENGVGRATLLGSGKQIMTMLRALEKEGFPYRVISLTEANFSSSSLLGLLTDKQRETLALAFRSGYYDIPRKTGSDELSRKMGIRNPTFVAHRRKAERRLIAEILKVS